MEAAGVEPMTVEQQQRQCEEAPRRQNHEQNYKQKQNKKPVWHVHVYTYGQPVESCRFEQGWPSLFCKPSTLNSPTSPKPHYCKLWSTNTNLIISYKDHSERRNYRGKEQKKWWRRLGWNPWPQQFHWDWETYSLLVFCASVLVRDVLKWSFCHKKD